MPTDGFPDPTAALRGLCHRPASAFGARLLARSEGRVVTFREFVRAAREMVRNDPDATATWLAALVALDMRGADCEVRDPSPN